MTGTCKAIFALSLCIGAQATVLPAHAEQTTSSAQALNALRTAYLPDEGIDGPTHLDWPEAAEAAPEETPAQAELDADELYCLTEALYFEARGESLMGVQGVAEVILNRRDSGAYPDTICGVINQGVSSRLYNCQFSYNCDGQPETINEPEAWDRMDGIARRMLAEGPRPLTKGATHYHTRQVSPSWASRIPRTAEIGAHLFYREPVRTASN